MNDLNYTALWGFLFGISAFFALCDLMSRSHPLRRDDPPTKWSYAFRALMVFFGSLTALTWGGVGWLR